MKIDTRIFFRVFSPFIAAATALYLPLSSQAQGPKPATQKSLAQQMFENQKAKQGVQQDKSTPLTKVTADGKLNVVLVGSTGISFSVKDPPPTGPDGTPLKFRFKEPLNNSPRFWGFEKRGV